MKLTNETRYDGRDIRGLLLACARYYEHTLSGTVRVEYYKPRKNHRRFASASGRTIRLAHPDRFEHDAVTQLAGIEGNGLPIPERALLGLCWIIEWIVTGEGNWPSSEPSERPSWARGRRVRIKPAPKKPAKPTGAVYQEDKIAKAEARLTVWRTRLAEDEGRVRRAATAIKKLKRELRERRGRIKRLQKVG